MIWKHSAPTQLRPQGGQPGCCQPQPQRSKGADGGKGLKRAHSNSSGDSVWETCQGFKRAKDEGVSMLWSRLNGYMRRSAKSQPAPATGKPVLQISIPKGYDSNRMARSDHGILPQSTCSSKHSPCSPSIVRWPEPKRLNRQNHVRFAISEGYPAPSPRRARPRKLHLSLDMSSSNVCVLCHKGDPGYRGLCQVCEDGITASSEVRTPTLNSELWRSLPSLPCALKSSKPAETIARLSSPFQAPELYSPATSIQSLMTPPPPLLLKPPTPHTPLSQMTTPTIELRFEIGKREPAFLDQDLYDADWADYYFDKKNFRGQRDAAGEADRFMHRELELDEYEAAFGTPSDGGLEVNWI